MVLLAGALALGATVGVSWIAGFDAIAHRLLHLHWLWLPVAFGAEVAAYVGYIAAYQGVATAEEGPELKVPHAAALVASGFGVFVLGGGFALDEAALTRIGLTRREARERVLGLATLEYVVLAPVAAAAAGVALVHEGVSPGLTLPWLIAVPVGGAVALLLVSRRTAFDRARRRALRAVGHALGGLALILRMATRPDLYGVAFLGIALYWAGDIGCLWATLNVVFAQPPPLAELLVGYATGYALTRRTLPLGGAGVVETLLPLSLGWVGIALAPAVLAVVGYRVINLWLPLVPAVAGLPTLRRLGHRRARANVS
jgi:uncharacterized membrane protein YbhN (UPF0104 family)